MSEFLTLKEAINITLAERICDRCKQHLGGKDAVELISSGAGYHTARITCPHCKQLIGTALVTLRTEKGS